MYLSSNNRASKLFAIACLFAMSVSVFAQSDDSRQKGKGKHQRPQFFELDLNGDGQVLLAEFKQRPVHRVSHEQIFRHIDANGDGAISEQEFVEHKPPPRPKRD
jgi:hypothetical protein